METAAPATAVQVHPAMPVRMVKRDGLIIAFDESRIREAIRRWRRATAEFDVEEAVRLTALAMKVLAYRYGDRDARIEAIRDVVEQPLIAADHFLTARHIVYREQHRKLRKDPKILVDVAAYIQELIYNVNVRSRWSSADPGHQSLSPLFETKKPLRHEGRATSTRTT